MNILLCMITFRCKSPYLVMHAKLSQRDASRKSLRAFPSNNKSDNSYSSAFRALSSTPTRAP